MSNNPTAIKEKLRRLDVLSGLWGDAPRAAFAEICEDLAINDVAGLVAEIERLQAEVNEYSMHAAESIAAVGQLQGALARSETVCRMSLDYDVHKQIAAENERLRAALWGHHGHVGLYGDDGEMQCNMAGAPADFKRDSVEQLEAHITPAITPRAG